MEYVYASLLLHQAKKPVDEASVKNVLTAAGIEADDTRIKALVASLKEVNIDDAIKSAAIPAAMPAAAAGGEASAATPAAKGEKKGKKEEKKEEGASEEEVSAGLGALFG